MNILILGGLGFLGKNLSKELSKRHDVFVVDVADIQEENYFKVNISEAGKIKKIIIENRIEVIIHLVSTLLPASEIDDFCKDVENVFVPTVQLVDFCAANSIKVVLFSSGGAVYGNLQNTFIEQTECKPISFYGLSKLNLENIIRFYHRTKKLNYIIIRPSNPYGYGQNIYGTQGLIAVIIGKIIKGETLKILGDGSAVKDYIFIDDFIFYVTCLLESNSFWNDTYNIGTGVGTSIEEVLVAFEGNGIRLPQIEFEEERQSDVNRMILDCSKIKQRFNHKCLSITDGIKLFWRQVNE